MPKERLTIKTIYRLLSESKRLKNGCIDEKDAAKRIYQCLSNEYGISVINTDTNKREYWKEFIGVFDEWHRFKKDRGYEFSGKDFSHLKKIYDFLKRRSESKKVEFNKKRMEASLVFFLNEAWDESEYVKKEMSFVPVLLSIFYKIIDKKKSDIKKDEPRNEMGLLNPPSFPTWQKEVSDFLADEYFIRQYVKEENLHYAKVVEEMKEFVKELNLKGDFKNTAAIKVHFINHMKKHKEKMRKVRNYSKAFIDVDKEFDYNSNDIIKW